jgi:uncharacterized membrane protein
MLVLTKGLVWFYVLTFCCPIFLAKAYKKIFKPKGKQWFKILDIVGYLVVWSSRIFFSFCGIFLLYIIYVGCKNIF